MPDYQFEDYIKVMRPLPKDSKFDIFEIPFIEKHNIDISKINNGTSLVSLNNSKENGYNAHKKIVHCFHYDNKLNSLYNDPIRFLKKVGKYYAVSSLDFSMHFGMTMAQHIEATFKNRWSGAFLQSYGLKVLATAGWTIKEFYDICFAGLRDGATLIISTYGICNALCHDTFIEGYKEIRRRFPNSKIICVGNRVDGMDVDICYVSYKESFGNFDQYHHYWQARLFNWDLTTGGD